MSHHMVSRRGLHILELNTFLTFLQNSWWNWEPTERNTFFEDHAGQIGQIIKERGNNRSLVLDIEN